MTLVEALEHCTENVWSSSRMRKRQIKALAATAPESWSTKDVSYWRDAAEIGWADGVTFVYNELVNQPSFRLPDPKAVKRTSGAPKQSLPGILIGKTVGSGMALHIARQSATDVSRLAIDLADSSVFVRTLSNLLDEGATRTANDGPHLDPSAPVDPMDVLWASARDAFQSSGSPSFDLVLRRTEVSPI